MTNLDNIDHFPELDAQAMAGYPNWLCDIAQACIWQGAPRAMFQEALEIVAGFEPDKRQQQYAYAAQSITNECLPSGRQINEWLLDRLFCAGASANWRDYKTSLAGNIHKVAFELGYPWNPIWEPMLRILEQHGYDIDEGGRWTAEAEKRCSEMPECAEAVVRMNAIKAPRLSSFALNEGTRQVAEATAPSRF